MTVLRWFLLLLAFSASCAWAIDESDAEQAGLPLYEIGVLGGAASLPDYPAAGQNHPRWMGLPYLIYRGKIVRADREGARARLWRTRFFDVEMSFGGSFPARSRDNDARRGMPNLDWLGEIGPRISIPLATLADRGQIKLFLPARAVFSTDFSYLKNHGGVVVPTLYARYQWRPEHLWISTLESTFGSRPLTAYFYDVAPAYATASRPEYRARAGYVGTQLFSGLVIPFRGRTVRVFAGALVNTHHGAVNEDSPLFRRRWGYGAIGGLSWSFFESRRTAALH